MPSHEEHRQDSLKRYGKRFDELHRWMDEPSTVLGPSHRKYRHDPNKTPQIAKVLFGPLADQACLDHIRLDELERRRKGIPFRGTYRMISPKQKVCPNCGIVLYYYDDNELGSCPNCGTKIT